MNSWLNNILCNIILYCIYIDVIYHRIYIVKYTLILIVYTSLILLNLHYNHYENKVNKGASEQVAWG